MAEPQHLEALSAIERNANVLFTPFIKCLGLTEDAPATDVGMLAKAQKAGLLWIAVDGQGGPIGFAQVERFNYGAHLHELDVDSGHQRQGIGAALVKTVCTWGDNAGVSTITLRTFLNIPWNAPFYRRFGFEVVADDEVYDSKLLEYAETEMRLGFNMAERVSMRRLRSQL